MTPEQALGKALENCDGPAGLARRLGITVQAVCQWKVAPAARVLDIEREAGVPRHELCPAMYPPPPNEEAA